MLNILYFCAIFQAQLWRPCVFRKCSLPSMPRFRLGWSMLWMSWAKRCAWSWTLWRSGEQITRTSPNETPPSLWRWGLLLWCLFPSLEKAGQSDSIIIRIFPDTFEDHPYTPDTVFAGSFRMGGILLQEPSFHPGKIHGIFHNFQGISLLSKAQRDNRAVRIFSVCCFLQRSQGLRTGTLSHSRQVIYTFSSSPTSAFYPITILDNLVPLPTFPVPSYPCRS